MIALHAFHRKLKVCIYWSAICTDSCVNHTNVLLYMCFGFINCIYIDWSAPSLSVSCTFHYRLIFPHSLRWVGIQNQGINKYNTNTVSFFLWSRHENYFGSSVIFCCQSAWWRYFGPKPPSRFSTHTRVWSFLIQTFIKSSGTRVSSWHVSVMALGL